MFYHKAIEIFFCESELRSFKRYEPIPSDGSARAVRAVCVEQLEMELDDEPGRAADAVKIFSDAGISIAYMYTFLLGGKGILVFRTDNREKAREAIILNNLKFIAEQDLSKLV